MRMPVDVVLSVQKYTADVLPGWEVRIAQDRGEINPGKPLAMVLPIGPIGRDGHSRWVELAMPMVIHCYPLRKDDLEDAEMQALDVTEMVLLGFAIQGVGLGRPLRVPLYDYTDVDVTVADSAVRGDHDFVRLENFDVSRLPDASDPRLIRIIAGFTTRWRRAGYDPTIGSLPLRRVTSVAGSGEYDVEEVVDVPAA